MLAVKIQYRNVNGKQENDQNCHKVSKGFHLEDCLEQYPNMSLKLCILFPIGDEEDDEEDDDDLGGGTKRAAEDDDEDDDEVGGIH